LIKKNDKLCIIGSAPTKGDAPYNDSSFDIWAISGAAFSESLDGVRKPDTEDNSWNCVPRVDVFFEMHKRWHYEPKLDKLKTCGCPVIMQRKEWDIPTSEAYPADEIAEALGEDFSSSIAYMLAYGVYLGYKEIRLYGVVLLHQTEYIRQRPSVKYYMGVARAKGITVWAPPETQLTTPGWRYGYDDHDFLCWQIMQKKETINEDIKSQTALLNANKQVLHRLEGAQQICDILVTEIKGGLG
jgi:hypothetical protein